MPEKFEARLRVTRPGDRPAIRTIASAAAERLARAIAAMGTGELSLLERIPLDRAATVVDAYRRRQAGTVLARGVPGLEEELLAAGGEAWSGTYRRLVVLQLLSTLPTRQVAWRIPEIAWEGIEPALQVLLEAIELPDFAGSSWGNGDFRKDLAAAQLRALPFDGMVNEVSMFSVRFETGRASLPERLRLAVYLRASYVRPRWWFARHAWRGHREQRRDWRPGQARLAAIVAVNRAIAGHTSATWLNDPQLDHVTPHLAEKATSYVAMGGHRFRGETSAETAGFALQASASRRKLHAEGRYDPRSYWISISRRDLLRWLRDELTAEAAHG